MEGGETASEEVIIVSEEIFTIGRAGGIIHILSSRPQTHAIVKTFWSCDMRVNICNRSKLYLQDW